MGSEMCIRDRGTSDRQTLQAMREAESYPGPSLIIAYTHCIAHGINMAKGLEQQKLASESGHWPLYRYDPRRTAEGKNPLQLDSKSPSIPLKEYIYNENRYRILTKSNPEAARHLLDGAQKAVDEKWAKLAEMAQS